MGESHHQHSGGGDAPMGNCPIDMRHVCVYVFLAVWLSLAKEIKKEGKKFICSAQASRLDKQD